jgi:hypothetical protein
MAGDVASYSTPTLGQVRRSLRQSQVRVMTPPEVRGHPRICGTGFRIVLPDPGERRDIRRRGYPNNDAVAGPGHDRARGCAL